VTSVGGTALQLTTTGRLLGTTAWTEPLLSQGSTGGQSTLFSQLRWQRAPGVTRYSDGSLCGQPAGRYCREVPDVSADAAPSSGAAVRVKGRWVSEGGTSLATPVWAALTSLIDQYLRGRGDAPVGFANPWLYRLASGSPPFPAIHDVTVGTNDFYPAGPGYDMVTGLGTPDAWNLARDLAPLTGRRS
jgi:kumamolisin